MTQINQSRSPIFPKELDLEGPPEEWKVQIKNWTEELTLAVEEQFKQILDDTQFSTAQLVETAGQPTISDIYEGQSAIFLSRLFINMGGVVYAIKLEQPNYNLLKCKITVTS